MDLFCGWEEHEGSEEKQVTDQELVKQAPPVDMAISKILRPVGTRTVTVKCTLAPLQSTLFQNPGGGTVSVTEDEGRTEILCVLFWMAVFGIELL